MKNELIEWIRNEVNRIGANGVVLGISGGIDSAVVAALAKEAFPNNSLGIWIDIESSKNFYLNTKKLTEKLEIELLEFDLTNIWKNLIDATEFNERNRESIEFKISSANTKSRLRMNVLYQIAKEKNYLVLGTSNKDEIYMGFFTKWGDNCADLYPIADLLKKDIIQLAKELKISKEIINSIPTADLWINQTDEAEMGIKYDDIDAFLSNQEISKDKKKIIEKWHNATEHKRRKELNKPTWKKNNL